MTGVDLCLNCSTHCRQSHRRFSDVPRNPSVACLHFGIPACLCHTSQTRLRRLCWLALLPPSTCSMLQTALVGGTNFNCVMPRYRPLRSSLLFHVFPQSMAGAIAIRPHSANPVFNLIGAARSLLDGAGFGRLDLDYMLEKERRLSSQTSKSL